MRSMADVKIKRDQARPFDSSVSITVLFAVDVNFYGVRLLSSFCFISSFSLTLDKSYSSCNVYFSISFALTVYLRGASSNTSGSTGILSIGRDGSLGSNSGRTGG